MVAPASTECDGITTAMVAPTTRRTHRSRIGRCSDLFDSDEHGTGRIDFKVNNACGLGDLQCSSVSDMFEAF